MIGRDGDEFISIEEMGDLSGRFSYEFACEISGRVPRVYIKDGKETENTIKGKCRQAAEHKGKSTTHVYTGESWKYLK